MDSDSNESDSDLEDAYDLRDVSSDVEMHPDDLLSDTRSNSAWLRCLWLLRLSSIAASRTW